MEAHLSRPLAFYLTQAWDICSSLSADVGLHRIESIWWWVRAAVLVPAVKAAVISCLVMSVMLVVEKLSMAAVSLYVMVFRRTPEKVYRWEPLSGDVELGSSAYPMVLVQIPMFNEREVYQLSIGAVCSLDWPSDRLIIQVLDDSTDAAIKDLVQKECERWLRKGMNIHYVSRDNRNGYKAGALKEAMELDYVKKCDYVAIFDADHQPPCDFLMRTIPFFIHNPKIALVQARWMFVNADECIMTRIQEMSLNYHFKVEQQSGSSTFAFFGFNGTAGVWRILALQEAEGWKERTTVEDMDLAVRATLRGWKFVYIGDLEVKSELPSTYKAYRYQQHRWACGPANLFKKMAWDIIKAKKVSIWRKFFLVYNFFFARRIVSYNVTFFFYCVVIPLSTFFPEVKIPTWGVVYIPTIITILNAAGTPSSLHLTFIWILFENVMSLHRCKAVYIGLFDAGRVNEWVVTEKLGNMLKTKPVVNAARTFQKKFWERFLFLEIAMGIFLFVCAYYDYAFSRNQYFIYIFPLSISFFIMGSGYVGIFIPGAQQANAV
ncbi:glucomannan 4-beta-mannosyltransferase 1-like isoform X2 [Phoenix dactylifera]|uniref:glucomannan 4-beta-mannosyltransferase n=1 Tax=Phoenix dactylifera TaxID=42345 RepID=A0A8B7BL24_PHODC|nr:glucomannan 4-beta-mannosyltransferase 1-like isoform X2 [Phoenix dactylifera]